VLLTRPHRHAADNTTTVKNQRPPNQCALSAQIGRLSVPVTLPLAEDELKNLRHPTRNSGTHPPAYLLRRAGTVRGEQEMESKVASVPGDEFYTYAPRSPQSCDPTATWTTSRPRQRKTDRAYVLSNPLFTSSRATHGQQSAREAMTDDQGSPTRWALLSGAKC